MSILDGILNNREAAVYLTERGYRIDSPTLSRFANGGVGPRSEKTGGARLYRVEWLDEFLETVAANVNTTNEVSNG